MEIYVFDTPQDSVGWVPGDILTASSSLNLNEGRLRADVALWNGPPPAGKTKGYLGEGWHSDNGAGEEWWLGALLIPRW